MDYRIEKLVNRVLKENDRFSCKDSYILSMLANANESEKLKIIKEEYAKIIEVDELSLLAGEYPTISFAELCETDYSNDWAFLNKKYQSYYSKVFEGGGNHLSADFEYIIKNGISELLNQIENKRGVVTDLNQKNFLDDMYYAAQSIIAWTQAYAEAFRVAAEKEQSKERCAQLLQISDICSRVPNMPATNFREAIQCYYFIFILFPDGMGRLDQYLYPYYLSDIEKGNITPEEALYLIEELFIKIFAHLGKEEIRSANNHCVVGGYTSDGECGHNECTSLILKAITELPIWRPQVSYRVNKIGASVNRCAKKYTPYRGGRYLFGTLTGYELSHIVFGKNSGASLDGRYAGDPFAASIAAFPRADKNGMTAYLKSAAKIDRNLIQSSVVVNLKIDRALADSEEKRKRLTAVLRTYFELGGIQLQINYLSADELIKAQQEPEKHKSLRVRVTGFSGFFTSFDKDLQDEIIQRYLHTS